MTEHNPSRTAFIGGSVWTEGFAVPRQLDVLVENDTIAEVAPAGELDTAGVTVHDISGSLLVPGFQDAHIHMGTGGLDLLNCNLAGLATPDEVFAAIAEYAAANPDDAWITGGGWHRTVFPYPEGPTRDQLDAIVSDRPVVLSPYDRHGMWLNSAALEAAGIDDSTPDPPGGLFRRDSSGRLTGMVEETATEQVGDAMPVLTLQQQKEAILAAQKYLLSLGVTSVQDAIVGTGLGMFDQHPAYCELLSEDDFVLRLTTAIWWDAGRGVEQIPEIEDRRRRLEERAGSERVIADTVKVMVEGSNQLFMTAEEIHTATVALDALGFTLHYHAYGEATTQWILDAIETAIAENGARERRHHIAHLFVVGEKDLKRFAELGVTANMQGYWMGEQVIHEDLGHSTFSDDPETREYPFGRLRAAGTHLAAGSDWPVTTPDPLLATRAIGDLLSHEPDRKAVPEHDRLDTEQMFAAYTAGSAFVNGRGRSTGRIAKGFLADLTLLDRDVFASSEALAEATVQEVWIGGRSHYRAD